MLDSSNCLVNSTCLANLEAIFHQVDQLHQQREQADGYHQREQTEWKRVQQQGLETPTCELHQWWLETIYYALAMGRTGPWN